MPAWPAAITSPTTATAASSRRSGSRSTRSRSPRTTSTPICTGCRISACRITGRARPRPRGGPFPDFGVNRNNFYGFVNRDFFKVGQDIGTINGEVQITPDLTLSDKVRASRSTLELYRHHRGNAGAYHSAFGIDTDAPIRRAAIRSPTSLANQTEATYKFDTGRLESHRARRRRDLARDIQHRQIYRAKLGSDHRRALHRLRAR